MGYDVHQFVEMIDANLVCGICGAVFENPVLTPCGHSFCLICLETWLQTSQKTRQQQFHYQQHQQQQLVQLQRRHRRPWSFPSAVQTSVLGSCPECREPVRPNEAKPEISLRNLINGFYMFCVHRDSGCHAKTKLELLKEHESRCPHSPVDCAGCGMTIRMANLAAHQIRCQGLAALIEDSDDACETQQCITCKGLSSISEPQSREPAGFSNLLEQMEKQMSFLKRDIADANNIILETESSKRTKEVNRQYRVLFLDTPIKLHNDVAIGSGSGNLSNERGGRSSDCGSGRAELNWFEYPSDYNRSNRSSLYSALPSISANRLASFIFRYLLNKPSYIDSRRVFRAIQDCYDDFTVSSHIYDHAVHVLMATANASDWFTEIQQKCFGQWLHSLVKCHELLESADLGARQT